MSFISFRYEQTSYTGIVVEAKENYYIFSSQLERLYIYEKDHDKEVGDIIYVEGQKEELDFTVIESGFDFETYLNKKGVYFIFTRNKEEIKFSNPLRVRAFKDHFLAHYSNNTRGLLSGILFADSEEYEGKDNLDGLHLNRLISASGIYYAIYLSFFTFLFSFMFKKKWARLIGILFLVAYSILLPGKFSIFRFLVFTSFRYVNDYHLKNKVSFLTYFPIIGICFILLNYHVVYTDSFLLGFSIPLLMQLSSRSFVHFKGKKKKAVIYILILLFFIPFDIKYHQEINLISYLMQIAYAPVFIVNAFVGLLSITGIPLYNMNEVISSFILTSSKYINELTLCIHLPPFNEVMIIIYYSCYFISIYYLSIRFKLIYKWIMLVDCLFAFTYISPIKNGLTNSVTFINVGQGDACLITSKYVTVLIDTGGSIYQDLATNCLIPYLKKRRIYNIDLLITTHDDYDHMGASSSLMEHFTVKKYIKDSSKFPIDVGNIHLINYNDYASSSKEENDQSLVIGFTLSNVNYLITGDAPKSIENKIMTKYASIPCDILKVGHHGSNTSTSDAFIKYLSPKEAVISVGKNYYGHPHKEVIDTLNRNKVKIHQTNIEGSITYTYYSFAL